MFFRTFVNFKCFKYVAISYIICTYMLYIFKEAVFTHTYLICNLTFVNWFPYAVICKSTVVISTLKGTRLCHNTKSIVKALNKMPNQCLILLNAHITAARRTRFLPFRTKMLQKMTLNSRINLVDKLIEINLDDVIMW